MGRGLCCENDHVNKGAWTKVEDEKLMNYIKTHGQGCWRSLPKAAGLLRCGKSCRLRWINYLRPDVKRGNFTAAEVELIIKLHSKLGNKWSTIAANLPGRTDNEIKNHWNTHIKRKLLQKGIDPQTHRPIAVEDGTSAAATNMFPLSLQDLPPRPPLVRDQANSSTGPSPHGGAPHHSISHGKISHKHTILDSYGHRPGPSVALSLVTELTPIPDTSVDLPIVPLLKTSPALPNPTPAVGNDGGARGGRTSNMNSHGICLCLHLGTTNCNPCRKEFDQSRSSSQDLRKKNTYKRTYND